MFDPYDFFPELEEEEEEQCLQRISNPGKPIVGGMPIGIFTAFPRPDSNAFVLRENVIR